MNFEICIANPCRGWGFCCYPSRKPPVIEIHGLLNYCAFEVTIECLIHEDLHLALYKISPEACAKYHNVEKFVEGESKPC